MTPFREAVVDLGAIRRNVARLRELAGAEHLIAVVKADGYGHGMPRVARAALEGGADWLGVADIDEALALRGAGVSAPLLAWLHGRDADFAASIRADVDLGVSSPAQLEAVAAAARDAGARASVQFKLDTGLSRNGCAESEWPALFESARRHEAAGSIRVRGVFSHLSNASAEDDAAAIAAFERGRAAARAAGLDPELEHLAATAAAIGRPEARYAAVRVGIGVYGLSPFPERSSADLGLSPAMTLRATVAAVRRVGPGTGVSYDYTYRTERETTLALVPLGYADGVPRQASDRAEVSIRGVRCPVRGRIAMDQFVVDAGDLDVAVGDDVVLFGPGGDGAPTADEWARAAGTINYDIVTGVGPRVPRRYVDG